MLTKQETKSARGPAIITTPVLALLDRVQLLAWPRGKKVPDIPGFTVSRDTFVHKETSIATYRRVRILKNHKTGNTLFIQYAPAAPWLAPAKITTVTQARRGLRR